MASRGPRSPEPDGSGRQFTVQYYLVVQYADMAIEVYCICARVRCLRSVPRAAVDRRAAAG
eukprot:COSAG02_NODE_4932_length_4819_cov_3.269915_1_plen_60_part_10